MTCGGLVVLPWHSGVLYQIIHMASQNWALNCKKRNDYQISCLPNYNSWMNTSPVDLCLSLSYLIMVLHELNYDFNIGVIIFDWDDAHYVGCIFGVWILWVFIGQDETGVGTLNLQTQQDKQSTIISKILGANNLDRYWCFRIQ